MWKCSICETYNKNDASEECECCGHKRNESKQSDNKQRVNETEQYKTTQTINPTRTTGTTGTTGRTRIKKRTILGIVSVVVPVLIVILLSSIHIWRPATCTKPETCAVCGKVRAPATGHKWLCATCTEPQKCLLCGATSHSALGHKWISATCTEPERCRVCGATGNPALGHRWKEATYEEPMTCTRCGQQTGQVKGYVGAIWGSWSEEISIRNHWTYAYELTQAVENCFRMTLEVTVTEYSGYPFGSWYLYARDLNGKWSHIGEFKIEKDTVYETQKISFYFDPAVSFDALTVIPRSDNQYSISYTTIYYDAQRYVD